MNFASVQHSGRHTYLQGKAQPAYTAAGCGPVLVLYNGPIEMVSKLSAVVDSVYGNYKHDPDLTQVMGGAARVTIAWRNNSHWFPSWCMLNTEILTVFAWAFSHSLVPDSCQEAIG